MPTKRNTTKVDAVDSQQEEIAMLKSELAALRDAIPAYRLEAVVEKPPAQWYVLYNNTKSDVGFPDMERDPIKYPGFVVPGNGPGSSGFLVLTGTEGLRLKDNIHLIRLLGSKRITEKWTDEVPRWKDPAPDGFYALSERVRNPVEFIVFGDNDLAYQMAHIRAYLGDTNNEDKAWYAGEYKTILQTARKYLERTDLPYKQERIGWCTEHLQFLSQLDL